MSATTANTDETYNQSNRVYYDYDDDDTTTNDGAYIYKNPRIIIDHDDDDDELRDPFIDNDDDDAIQIYDPIKRYQSKPQFISPLRLLRLILTVAIFIGWNRYIIRMMWGERSIPLNPNRDRSSAAVSFKLESNDDMNVNGGGGLRKLVDSTDGGEDMDGQ